MVKLEATFTEPEVLALIAYDKPRQGYPLPGEHILDGQYIYFSQFLSAEKRVELFLGFLRNSGVNPSVTLSCTGNLHYLDEDDMLVIKKVLEALSQTCSKTAFDFIVQQDQGLSACLPREQVQHALEKPDPKNAAFDHTQRKIKNGLEILNESEKALAVLAKTSMACRGHR